MLYINASPCLPSCVPWTMRPWDDAPLDDAPLGGCVPDRYVPDPWPQTGVRKSQLAENWVTPCALRATWGNVSFAYPTRHMDWCWMDGSYGDAYSRGQIFQEKHRPRDVWSQKKRTGTVRGVFGNKCAGQHNLKTVNFREKLASSNFLARLSAVWVFCSALSTLGQRGQAFM